jgi:hypothetical protein
MPTPLISNFASDGSADTETTLALGAKAISCTLTENLSDAETNRLVLDNAGDAPRRGVAVIGSEIIYYGMRDKSDDPPCLYDLIRGQDGTEPASHAAGAVVGIYGPSRFGNPAIPGAIIASQQEIIDMRSTIADLLARVAVLEGQD